VKSLSFTIHPLAQWSSRISVPRPRQDALLFRRKVGPHTRSKPDVSESTLRPESAGKTASPAFSITRDVFQAKMKCPSHAIRGTNQTTYKNHSISTTQWRNGLWVAAFGRLDGKMMEIGSAKHAVLETLPHQAETIAIADAQLQIDEQQGEAS
jgi:hypothetical protein